MKKVKLFDFGLKTLTVVLAVCISSCSLNEEPEFSLNTTNVFESQSSAETVLKQSYGWLAAPQVYGQFLHDVTPANGVYWAKTDAGRLERSVTYDYYAERQLLPDMWQGLYRAIAESNYLIDGLDNSGLSDDYKTRALAHARFVRGFAYFKLANLFGQAVVLTEPVSTANLESPLSDRDVVYQQAIDDLVFASENLLEEEMMDGLAVKNTAIAYLAKTYWMMASQTQGAGGDATQLYNTAKSYGDQVIDEYALELNYGDLWVNHISGSPESIFQLNFTLANGVQNRATFNFGPNGGWGFFAPGSPSWGNMRIDRAFYDYHRGTYPDDPRMEVNYFSAWTNQRNGSTVYSYPYVRYNDWSTGEPVEVIYDMYADAPRLPGDTPTNPDYDFDALPDPVKGLWNSTYQWDRNLWPFNQKMANVGAVSNYDPRNLVIFRYADLLLLMADVENELGNTNVALDYLNQVLDRARQSGDGATYPMTVTTATQAELRDKIFFERMFELAGEPDLFEDIRRRGTSYLEKVMNIHNDSKNVQYRHQFEVANGVGGLFRDYIISNGNITEDFLTKNLLLPIPANEINNNRAIDPSDQNPGY